MGYEAENWKRAQKKKRLVREVGGKLGISKLREDKSGRTGGRKIRSSLRRRERNNKRKDINKDLREERIGAKGGK